MSNSRDTARKRSAWTLRGGSTSRETMKPQLMSGCHALQPDGSQGKQVVSHESWFCIYHAKVSTLDAVWEIRGTLKRIGAMSREQVQALMEAYAEVKDGRLPIAPET